MADWSFVIGDTLGRRLAEIQGAASMRFRWSVSAGTTASFSIDGHDLAAYKIRKLKSDLLAYRGEQLMFRGRIASKQHDLDGTDHTVNVTAVDYRGLLEQARRTQATLTYTGDTKKEIAAALLAHTQGLAGGDLGITMGDGDGPAGTHDREYEPDKEIGVAISELGESIVEGSQFEWEIDPQMRLNLFTPRRGTHRRWVGWYGQTIGRATVSDESATFGNVVAGTGDPDTTTRRISVAAGLADWELHPEGRIERVFGDRDIKVQATLNDRTDARLAVVEADIPTYTFEINPEVEWHPELVWIGDTTRLVIQDGCLNVDTVERVTELDLSVSNEGDETVALTWGTQRREDDAIALRKAERRLTNLERTR